jgi:hypothetical protein
VTYPQSIAATFDLAIGEAEGRCRAAEHVMAFLGYCAPVRLPVYCLQGLADREEAIAVLAELSLIKHDPFEDGVPAVSVHRLVQAVARHRTEAKGTAEATIERVSEGLSLPPPPSPRSSGLFNIRELIIRVRPLPHHQHLGGISFSSWPVSSCNMPTSMIKPLIDYTRLAILTGP